MRHRPAPKPEPLQREYLNTIYRTCQEPITQALLCEIARLHQLVRDAEGLRQSIEKVLKDQGGGQLAAAHQLRVLLSPEPALQKPPPKPKIATPAEDFMFPPDNWPNEPPVYGR